MAGDWIKIEHVTPEKPEVLEMAEILSADPDAIFGKLIKIWIWADQQSLCDAVSVTENFIDRKARVTGFAKAMCSVGWLIAKGDRLTFPNFDRHNGQTSKQRALTSKRAKKYRDAHSVTESSPEKRREELIPPIVPQGGRCASRRKSKEEQAAEKAIENFKRDQARAEAAARDRREELAKQAKEAGR